MPYTLWSDGVLLGETDLAMPVPQPEARVGVFHPTAAGGALIPTLLQVPLAVLALASVFEREDLTKGRLGDDLGPAIHDAMQSTPELQRLRAAQAAVDALHLELKDEAGANVPAAHISLSDVTAFDADPADLMAEVEADEDAAAFGRYLLSVILKEI
jgi:hypothetical protein